MPGRGQRVELSTGVGTSRVWSRVPPHTTFDGPVDLGVPYALDYGC